MRNKTSWKFRTRLRELHAIRKFLVVVHGSKFEQITESLARRNCESFRITEQRSKIETLFNEKKCRTSIFNSSLYKRNEVTYLKKKNRGGFFSNLFPLFSTSLSLSFKKCYDLENRKNEKGTKESKRKFFFFLM